MEETIQISDFKEQIDQISANAVEILQVLEAASVFVMLSQEAKEWLFSQATLSDSEIIIED